MTPEQRDKLDRWIEAHLDGRLDAEQQAQFDQLCRNFEAVRKELALQQAVDQSLKRSFNPPEKNPQQVAVVPAAEAGAVAEAAAPAVKAKRFSRAFIGIAAAVVLLIGGGGGWLYWRTLNPVLETRFPPPRPRLTLAQLYQKAKDKDFQPEWVCKDDKQFITTFYWKLNHALAMTSLPADVKSWGLTYALVAGSKSHQVVLATGKIDGRGIMVLVDNVEKDQGQSLDPAHGLHLHKRKLEHLVLYEVSPLAKPLFLHLFEERDMPQAWIDEGYQAPPGETQPGSPSP